LDSENPDSAALVYKILEANGEHLESLEIETVDNAQCLLHIDQFIGDNRWKKGINFISLQHLSLSEISLDRAYPRTAWSFHFGKLQTLRLYNCPYSFEFLKNMAESACNIIKLRLFEIVFNESHTNEIHNEAHPIGDFLTAFEGLEELYISIQNTKFPIKPLVKSIFRHSRTLRRLVHHERGIDAYAESNRYDLACDYPLPWEPDIDRVLSRMALESVGLCVSPSSLVRLSINFIFPLSI
jgi:hypothetical protein